MKMHFLLKFKHFLHLLLFYLGLDCHFVALYFAALKSIFKLII